MEKENRGKKIVPSTPASKVLNRPGLSPDGSLTDCASTPPLKRIRRTSALLKMFLLKKKYYHEYPDLHLSLFPQPLTKKDLIYCLLIEYVSLNNNDSTYLVLC